MGSQRVRHNRGTKTHTHTHMHTHIHMHISIHITGYLSMKYETGRKIYIYRKGRRAMEETNRRKRLRNVSCIFVSPLFNHY